MAKVDQPSKESASDENRRQMLESEVADQIDVLIGRRQAELTQDNAEEIVLSPKVQALDDDALDRLLNGAAAKDAAAIPDGLTAKSSRAFLEVDEIIGKQQEGKIPVDVGPFMASEKFSSLSEKEKDYLTNFLREAGFLPEEKKAAAGIGVSAKKKGGEAGDEERRERGSGKPKFGLAKGDDGKWRIVRSERKKQADGKFETVEEPTGVVLDGKLAEGADDPEIRKRIMSEYEVVRLMLEKGYKERLGLHLQFGTPENLKRPDWKIRPRWKFFLHREQELNDPYFEKFEEEIPKEVEELIRKDAKKDPKFADWYVRLKRQKSVELLTQWLNEGAVDDLLRQPEPVTKPAAEAAAKAEPAKSEEPPSEAKEGMRAVLRQFIEKAIGEDAKLFVDLDLAPGEVRERIIALASKKTGEYLAGRGDAGWVAYVSRAAQFDPKTGALEVKDRELFERIACRKVRDLLKVSG